MCRVRVDNDRYKHLHFHSGTYTIHEEVHILYTKHDVSQSCSLRFRHGILRSVYNNAMSAGAAQEEQVETMEPVPGMFHSGITAPKDAVQMQYKCNAIMPL